MKFLEHLNLTDNDLKIRFEKETGEDRLNGYVEKSSIAVNIRRSNEIWIGNSNNYDVVRTQTYMEILPSAVYSTPRWIENFA